MTKIKNSEGNGELTVYDAPYSNGFTRVEVRDTRNLAVAGGWFNTAEVLDALGAVDKVDVIAAERAAEEWRARAERAEAECQRLSRTLKDAAEASSVDLARAFRAEAKLAEAEATIERVRGTLENADADDIKIKFYNKLQRALAPKPAFELPTAVPARIIAVKSSTGDEKELTLFTDGDTTWWADIEDWGPFWTRSQVMDQFTGHRLLDGDS